MVRTQIQLDEQAYEEIRRLAHKERISFSAAVRQLVDQALHGKKPQRRRGARALLDIAGIAKSGLSDLGRRHDKYLAEDGD